MQNAEKFRLLARAVLDFAKYTRQVYEGEGGQTLIGNRIDECADISLVEALQKIAGEPRQDRKVYSSEEKLRRALQSIANLPMTRRKGQPDPHLRARRIAVAALGGNPQKISPR